MGQLFKKHLRFSKLSCLCLLFLHSTGLWAQGEHVAYPSGKTLPEGVVGYRSVLNQKISESSWDDKGRSGDLGVDAEIVSHAAVLQYGLSPRLTLQLMVPWVVKNQAVLGVDRFRDSKIYREVYKQKVEDIYRRKEVRTLFPTMSSFQKALDEGLDLPVPMELELSTGEKIRVGNQASIHNYLDSLIVHGASPQEGALGLADIRLGALYQVYGDEWRIFSVGFGAEAPTANADLPKSKRPLGSGLWSVGLRASADVSPFNGLWLSYQHQLGQSVGRQRKDLPSLLDNTKVIIKNDEFLLYERFGIKQDASFAIKYGFGALTPMLKPFAVGSSLSMYKGYQDVEHHFVGQKVETTRSPVAQGYTQSVSLRADALPYGVPLAMEWEATRTLFAQNQMLSFAEQSLNLYAYYKF